MNKGEGRRTATTFVQQSRYYEEKRFFYINSMQIRDLLFLWKFKKLNEQNIGSRGWMKMMMILWGCDLLTVL